MKMMGLQLLHHAYIDSLDSQIGIADAMVIHEGRILTVGKEAELNQQYPLAEKIDMNGRVLLPGFNDAHIHIWKVGSLITHICDVRGVRSKVELFQKLKDFALANPGNKWIMARGFNEALWHQEGLPTKEELDRLFPDRPCHLMRTCAHMIVVNSVALQIAQVNEYTIVPNGGEIRKYENGTLNGVLTETAMGLVQAAIPPFTHEDYREMILAAQDQLLAKGITSATDPAVMPDVLAVYKALDKEGLLKIRINAFPIRVPDGSCEALPLPSLYSSSHLQINTVKFFSDGGLSGKTAALKKHYKNTSERGVLRLVFEKFLPLAIEAQEAGFKIATHAIGDAAIEMVLSVYEQLQSYANATIQHRIEHLGLPEKLHLKKMAELSIACVTQPIFLYELGANFRQYLPDDYLEQLYPYQSVLEAKVPLVFSSDAPVVNDFSPLMGIQNAVERLDIEGCSIGSQQCIQVDQALQAYTIGGAVVDDALEQKGTLTPNKWADFIVLDAHPSMVEAKDIHRIQVLQSWVNGRQQYSKCDSK